MDELTYKGSGVDIDEGNRAVDLIKPLVARTVRKEVLTGLGGFGGLFQLDTNKYKEPVLISGTDGVGTKLKIAIMADKHDTVGIDLVAMCVNDILTSGAEPLFFLDYIATGQLKAEKVKDIVKGISEGCVQSEMALIGGETAEMPDMYGDGDYDLAGFAVGVVDKEKIIDGSKIEKGDILLGIPSSGIHSNGFSLVRKIVFSQNQLDIHTEIKELRKPLKDILLTPTRIYHKDLKQLKENIELKGIAHITGGGLYENAIRILPDGLDIQLKERDIPELFQWLQKMGNVPEKEMHRVFNMGVGMVIIISKENREKAMSLDLDLMDIGEIV